MKSWEAREFIFGKITDNEFRNLKTCISSKINILNMENVFSKSTIMCWMKYINMLHI